MHLLLSLNIVLFCVSSCFPIVSNQIVRVRQPNYVRTRNDPFSSILPFSSKLGITQTFQTEPEYLEINPGANALMECRVYGKARTSLCIWQKDGKPIRMPQDGKYEWYGASENGDCSLRILKVDINYDDGEWKCQVTSSSYDSDDALSSRPARLVVRTPPNDPQIYYKGHLMSSKEPLEIQAGKEIQLRCESQGGNPAPIIKWYIDNQELDGSLQKNETSIGNERTWNAISIIRIIFQKENNGKELKCLALHDAYSRKSRERVTILDVLYAPIVRLERKEGENEFEANVDSMHIKCMADANPKPDVIWRKAGGESLHSLGEDLTFDPVRRGDGGTYYCLAKNKIGSSDELSTTFEVLSPPTNIRTRPERVANLTIGDRKHFECFAEGYPKPSFEWLQTVTETYNNGKIIRGNRRKETVYARGKARIIGLAGISYENEGLWTCVAKNVIKGKERKISSNGIIAQVSGKPQVMRYRTDETVWVPKHTNGKIDVVFCSNPKYKNLFWEWGVVPNIIQMHEDQQRGRFKTSNITNDPRQNCYQTTLTINDILPRDSMMYYVSIENDRGKTRFGIRLMISDPISMTAVVGIVTSALLLILVAFVITGYAYKRRKLCFKDTIPVAMPSKKLSNKKHSKKKHSNDSTKTLVFSDNVDSSCTEPRSKSMSNIQNSNKKSTNISNEKERSRSRSWMQHPSSISAYSPRRRPPTPPNMARHEGTIRPTLAKFSDSLYPDNVMDDLSQEIVIPRALTIYGKTPQNLNYSRRDGNASSSESSNSPTIRTRHSRNTRSIETNEPRGPVVMYTDLHFPPSPSQLQEIVSNKKDSAGSNVTLKAKLSSEQDRFKQSIMRSRDEIFTKSNDEPNENQIM